MGKACQKNALCKKLMECKAKAQQKPKPTKPTDACKKELAACNKDKVCSALYKKLAKAMADAKKGQQGKPQDKKKDPKKQQPKRDGDKSKKDAPKKKDDAKDKRGPKDKKQDGK